MPVDWDQLIELIDDNRVVPVVSKELLTYDDGNGGGLLYPYFAQQLAHQLGVSTEGLTRGSEINDVACRYLATDTRENPKPTSRIYNKLNRVVAESEAISWPVPLLQLARITPFRLFVTTTFDSSMARALNKVRFQGQPRTRVLAYTRSKQDDLSADHPGTADVPTVFHLFGKAEVSPRYAVTQWDVVEYFHDLYSGPRPERLLDELRQQSMLILGSGFEGWLTRFFLRIAKGQLGSGVQIPDYIADRQISADSNLVLFIQVLRRGTEMYSVGGPVQFVDELYKRWKDRHPREDGPSSARAEPPVKGAVFLSYAKEDRECVEKIKTALADVGVDVFVDDECLKPGQEWEPMLRRRINDASVFIPVISQHSLSEGRRYFRKEWRLAIEESQEASFSPNLSFLVPVSIDGTHPDHPEVPVEFSRVQWESIAGCEPTEAFVARVRELYRNYQKYLAMGGN